MITRAHIQNFRCLRDIELGFEPLTILVGPNASGKSALIAALDPSSELGGVNCFRGTGRPAVDLFWEAGARIKRNENSYALQPMHLDVTALRTMNLVEESPKLQANGGNLANVFATLTRAEQTAVAKDFSRLVPMYNDVVARPASSGAHRLVFQDGWLSSLWYEPAQVSDGSLLLLAFLVLQYQRSPVDILAIEEPERGLHPYLVGELVKMLRRLAAGELGPKKIQVIVATHSAELLEFAEPREVRFLSRRDSDGTTQVESAPTDSAKWANAFRAYQQSLGAIWQPGAPAAHS